MLRHAARTLIALVVFVAALIVGVDLHLGLPAAKRAAIARVNALFGTLFVGKLTIERIGGLGLSHVDGAAVRLEAPDGKVLVHATGVAGRISTAKLLRSLRRGEIVVDIREASVDSAEVDLDTDASGVVAIAAALQPRSPATPGPPGPAVRLTIRHARLKHAVVGGQIGPLPRLDSDVGDSEASVAVAPEGIVVDVTRTKVSLRSVPAVGDAEGNATAHVALPSATGKDLGLRVTYAGTVGTIATTADFAFDGGVIDASVDAPNVAPAQLERIVPAWPLVAPATVHAEAHGALPRVAVLARAAIGGATLDVAGPLTVAPRLQGALRVDAKGVNTSLLLRSAPKSDLSAAGDISFAEQPGGGVDVRAVVDLPAGRLSGARTPPVTLNAELAVATSSEGSVRGTIKAAVHEPGAPTVITARLAPKKGSVVVSFDADANVPDLSSVAWLGGVAQGRALAHAEGTLDFAADVVDAKLSVAGEDLDASGVHAQAARAEVHATGRSTHPLLDLQLAGEGVEAGGLSCSSVSGRGRMAVDEAPTLRDVEVEARSAAGHRVRVEAKLLRVAGDEVRVEDAIVHGLGVPVEATFGLSPGRLHVRARSEHIDLGRVAKFTQTSLLRGGRVSLDVDVTIGAGSADGRVAIDVSHAAFASFRDATAHVDATLHGRQAAGQVTANFSDVGSIEVTSSSIEVGAAGPLALSSWRRAWGAIDVKALVDLPKLAAHLPTLALPVRPVAGELQIAGRAERDSMSDSTPAIDWAASTTGLVLAGGTGAGAWRLEGLDPTVRIAVDGDTGATSIQAQIRDKTGVELDLEATSSSVPYANLFAGREMTESLRSMPFDARLTFPPRNLQALPAAWGVASVPGELGVNADWHGSVESPALHVSATLEHGQADPSAAALPVDLALRAEYDGAHATATLEGRHRDRVAIEATAKVDVRAPDAFAALQGVDVPWTGSARAKLDALSLRTLAFLSDRQVRGRLSGIFTLDGLHDDARASATATIDGLSVGDVACPKASLQATLADRAFDATARVDQSDGYVQARAHAGMQWGRALVPQFDASQASEAVLSARQMRAALLWPFVSGLFASLDGRIDADARVAVDPATRAARPEGTLTLTNGDFELTSLGGEFSDVSARATLSPDGLLRVENMVAHGVSGRIEGAASARIAGLAFAGARATVQIPKTEPVPVVFDGVKVGTMDGHFDIAIDWSRAVPSGTDEGADKALDVTVDVPTLHVELPVSGSHDVQALGDLDGVTTGVYRSGSDFVEVPLDTTVSAPSVSPRVPIKIALRLGRDVEVRRGDDVDVRLAGQPTITIANDVTVRGQITLQRGTLDIYGKPFEIEKGTVSFVGSDPSDPQVVLTAGWTAQDGTRVYADFVGPLKTGKVTLRSEPPQSQNDILALIMVGSTETGTATEQAGASTVAGAAGGAATQPINRALGGVNRALQNLGLAGGISTKIDTSQINPRPEVELQIARDISLQVAWVLGTLPPGANPDTTLVTLNWRFLRNWSLATTVGDAGTSILDLIWQHRY